MWYTASASHNGCLELVLVWLIYLAIVRDRERMVFPCAHLSHEYRNMPHGSCNARSAQMAWRLAHTPSAPTNRRTHAGDFPSRLMPLSHTAELRRRVRQR